MRAAALARRCRPKFCFPRAGRVRDSILPLGCSPAAQQIEDIPQDAWRDPKTVLRWQSHRRSRCRGDGFQVLPKQSLGFVLFQLGPCKPIVFQTLFRS